VASEKAVFPAFHDAGGITGEIDVGRKGTVGGGGTGRSCGLRPGCQKEDERMQSAFIGPQPRSLQRFAALDVNLGRGPPAANAEPPSEPENMRRILDDGASRVFNDTR
jgi:hypothetical protein